MNSKWVKSKRKAKRGEKRREQKEILPFHVKGSKDFSKNQEEEDEELTVRGI